MARQIAAQNARHDVVDDTYNNHTPGMTRLATDDGHGGRILMEQKAGSGAFGVALGSSNNEVKQTTKVAMGENGKLLLHLERPPESTEPVRVAINGDSGRGMFIDNNEINIAKDANQSRCVIL